MSDQQKEVFQPVTPDSPLGQWVRAFPGVPSEDEINRLEKAAWDAGVDHVLVAIRDERDAVRQRLAEVEAERDAAIRLNDATDRDVVTLRAERERLREALRQLRLDANRLCDRNLGGTYEDDCRRSITQADAALAPRLFAADGPQDG